MASHDARKSRKAYMWLGFGFMLGVIGDGLSFLATISRNSWLSSVAITQIATGVGLLICSNYCIVKMTKSATLNVEDPVEHCQDMANSCPPLWRGPAGPVAIPGQLRQVLEAVSARRWLAPCWRRPGIKRWLRPLGAG
jgi:hypothetical protein